MQLAVFENQIVIHYFRCTSRKGERVQLEELVQIAKFAK